MKLQRTGSSVFRLSLHAYELAALVAAGRCVVEEKTGDLTKEARQNLKRLLQDYDSQLAEVTAQSTSESIR